MKASELILILAELKAKHGDVEVLCESETEMFIVDEVVHNSKSPFNDSEIIIR